MDFIIVKQKGIEKKMTIKTPPMGWNSWNTFGWNINEKVVKDAADMIVEKGLKDAGYEYVVIDDCWSLRERGNDGRIVPDPEKFPNGMKALADYIHSKGLKFGMYSCSGSRTCAGFPGSFDHEFVDAKTFAEWGVDFLKYDYCNKPALMNGPILYNRMSMALKASGRDILFSACNWGCDEVEKWVRSAGVHMYRSTGDIFDNFDSFKNIAISQTDKLAYSATGCYNDIDMLIVGMHGEGNVANGGCSDVEYRTHFALWCLFQSPLMIGCDLTKVSDVNLEVLKNKDLIAIDQDPDCRPPMVLRNDSMLVLFKHMANGEYVLAFFNFSDKEDWRDLELYDLGITEASGMGFRFKELITGSETGLVKTHFASVVPAHDCRIYRGILTDK